MPRLSQLPIMRIALALALAAALPLHAQKKSAPAPSKPAPAVHPASGGASHPSAPSGGAHPGGMTTASHGPTTASHGPTTSGIHTGGPEAGHAGMTTGGRPGEAGHPGAPGGARLADHGPMAHPGPAHDREVHLAGGGSARMRPNGRPADFHDARRGMDVHHNLVGGGRRVMVERPDHSRLVFERGRPGYIAHPYMFHGHEFARRAYYFHGHAYNRFYAGYGWHGVHLEVYAPLRFYPVGFYGWAYHPWGRSIAYSWGWGGNPWYGYYGGYFTPYPVYGSPSLWLTDYMISQDLQASYEAAAAAGPPPAFAADAAPLTPDVKQMVADEVQRQLALENTEAALNAQGQAPDPGSSSIARMLSDGQPHTFVAGSEVDVVDASGAECAVTDGDVLQLTTPPGPAATEAQVMVMSSKGGPECHKMAVVSVPLEDLQEMQNHMRETLDQGLADLQAKQGKGGLPPAPPSAMVAPVNSTFAADAPPPEPGGDQELASQAQTADQSEQQELATAGGGPSAEAPAPIERSAPPPPTSVNITPGQSVADVTAQLGQPQRIVNLGPKKIYFYNGMKITFKSDKVTDIE